MLDHAAGEEVNMGNKYSKMMIAGIGGLVLILIAPTLLSYIAGVDITSGKVNASDATALIPPDLLKRTFGAGQLIGGIIAAIVLAIGGIKLELKKRLASHLDLPH